MTNYEKAIELKVNEILNHNDKINPAPTFKIRYKGSKGFCNVNYFTAVEMYKTNKTDLSLQRITTRCSYGSYEAFVSLAEIMPLVEKAREEK